MQNPTQKRFTKGSSPMNAAIPVEEAYKILTDEKQNGHLEYNTISFIITMRV
jgi:hypothetical protein